jgi:hemolysin-activating ACP:hemolysin acyltransferase
MAIEPKSNETQTKWEHGEFQVMIQSPATNQPIGFCDGVRADEEEILEQAMQEGAEVVIDKKKLKTGREIWTVRTIAEI